MFDCKVECNIKLRHSPFTMLTLDSITLFFYSQIVGNNDQPPSKKKRAVRDPISTWIKNVPPNMLPPNRPDDSRTVSSFNPLPSLMVGATGPSLNSALTNDIRIMEKGIYSDCNETIGQERDEAVSSPFKNGVRATSSVHSGYLFDPNLSFFSLEYGLQEQIKINCCSQGLEQL